MKYTTIVVDPPWAYRQKWATPMAGGKMFYDPLQKRKRAAKARGSAANYGDMTLEDIAAIPVGDWAAEQSHLYIWTTNGFMVEAHQLMEAWGFTQKTILTWVKTRLGMGMYYRNNTEHVIFGIRGKRMCERHDLRTAFNGAQGAHSEKPAAFYDMVQTMSPGPYLDVFARKPRFFWDVWGDEVGAPEGLPTPDEVRVGAK